MPPCWRVRVGLLILKKMCIDRLNCHIKFNRFYSVVKENYEKSAKVYMNNCLGRNYGPSCFNLGRLFSESILFICDKYLSYFPLDKVGGKGVPQSDEKAEEMFGAYCYL